jgi:hypothetical protein
MDFSKRTISMTRNTLLAALAIAVALPGFSSAYGATAYKEVAVADGGSIKGKLSFEGPLPEDATEQILISKNPEVCDTQNTGYREVVWVDVQDGALRGAFVFIDKIKEGKAWGQPEGGAYVIDQKSCRFRPWAQVVRPGPVVIRHSDPGVLHNINTREMIGVEKEKVVKRTMFNFGQPDPGDINEQIKPRRSPYIAINCEAHNFMLGYMMAPKHPYAVVVGEDGSFVLDDVPPGKYTLKAWHPKFGVKKAKLEVPAKGAVEADFVFSASE